MFWRIWHVFWFLWGMGFCCWSIRDFSMKPNILDMVLVVAQAWFMVFNVLELNRRGLNAPLYPRIT